MKCPKCKTVIRNNPRVLLPSERRLPELLQSIADVVGLDAALAIAGYYGGQKLYFPAAKWLEDGHPSWIVDLIGREKAVLLARRLFASGGFELVVPSGPTSGSALKYLKIKELRGRGFSVNEISREIGAHRRTVFLYLAAIRQEEAEKQQPADQEKRQAQ